MEHIFRSLINMFYVLIHSGTGLSFQVQYWIGWKPDPSQPKPLKPNQSADISLKDIYKLDEVVSQKMGEKGFILPGMVTKSFPSFLI